MSMANVTPHFLGEVGVTLHGHGQKSAFPPNYDNRGFTYGLEF